MFPLYAIAIGLGAGLLAGGRLSRLGRIDLRWAPLALIGLMAQVILFAEPVAARVGSPGAPIYVASSVLVLVALLRNAEVAGLKLVAVGAIANLAAIIANGGSMPASADALAALGKSIGAEYSNSVTVADPALRGLTDVYAMPRLAAVRERLQRRGRAHRRRHRDHPARRDAIGRWCRSEPPPESPYLSTYDPWPEP